MATTTNSRPAPGSRRSSQREHRSLLVVLIIALAVGIVGGGYVIGRDLVSTPTATTESSASPPRPAVMPPAPVPLTPAPVETDRFAEEFAAAAADLDARVGIEVRPVGAGAPPVTAGDWTTGTAWSTIKVPLALAGLRATDPPAVTEDMRAAITQSDNAAAEAIWASLGDPATAAGKVEAILAEAGAPVTVQSQRVRPEFTAFGQTEWSLADQATFLSSAACNPANQPVIDLMGQIAPDQRWGLGEIPGAKFKGGWGPSLEGDYLVRQFGVVPVGDGLAVVAVAVEPNSGAFDDGTQALTRIATWLQAHTDLLPVGNC